MAALNFSWSQDYFLFAIPGKSIYDKRGEDVFLT
jgi:hypothetical protein